ncbi:chitobiase/beta-hexosaminidase C-terminal domain-containing protein [Luteolibacter ambystomatis]|uniref:Chitobiase/beta-hexosaminidase C-terminal domain-containing protein n=1 Tax=Luteolibacter ambystomatis TaxID=2824561 RepID=A0A975J328_9BACT|nr:chitobiase/beta-hexosaminidase C-terminal domain-containing protein [Luteolibacter ambystomatis]QUE53152.1 chitobiase/beta-hexosaminidase C-terminal domain-containing protein [Luteolibacter ambystomatis]
MLKSLPILALGCSSVSAVVVDAPIIPVASGSYKRGGGFFVTCTTPGATIRYTLNGQEPTVNDPIAPFPGIVSIGDNVTFKAKAWVGADSSPTTTRTYTFTGDIVAGSLHTVMMDAVGNAYAWGAQNNGRLANLTTGSGTAVAMMSYASTTPVRDAGSIAAGQDQSLIIGGDSPFGVGSNSNGQVGDDTLTTRSGFVNVSDGSFSVGGCEAVAAGNNFSGALSFGGNVYTWGSEITGRLGNGNNLGNRKYAGLVTRGDVGGAPSLSGIVEIEFGGAFGVAREAHADEVPGGTGKVWTWGNNSSGQLGLGHTNNRLRAFPVMLDSTTQLTDVTAISGGQIHTAVVRWKTGDANLQGSVWSFGERGSGRLGNNVTSSGNVVYPVQAEIAVGVPLQGIKAVSAGASHTLALDKFGRVWAWGNNAKGQLGDNTTTSRGYAGMVRTPDNSTNLSGIVAIAAGGEDGDGFSLAIADDGTVYSWGSNTHSQLGTPSSGSAQALPDTPSVWNPAPELSTVDATSTVTTGTAPGAATVALTRNISYQDGAATKFELWVNGALHTTRTPAVPADWNVNLTSLSAGSYTVVAVVYDIHGNMIHSDQDSFTIN